MTTIPVAVPRKGRPLEAVLERVAAVGNVESVADAVVSTLRYEKAVTKGDQTADGDVYDRLAAYSDTDPHHPEYTLLRDARPGSPRRIVFDSLRVEVGEHDLHLVGREEPFRALRKHEFPLGFDSADLVLEEIVSLGEEPLTGLDAVNERISPADTDVRVVTGLGDTVYHTLMARPELLASDQSLDRAFVGGYDGELCLSPRYERLVEAILGTKNTDSIEFTYPENGQEEEAAIAETGLGVYITVTGSTAREHGLVVGEKLFPSETVLLSNVSETDDRSKRVVDELLAETRGETEIPAPQS